MPALLAALVLAVQATPVGYPTNPPLTPPTAIPAPGATGGVQPVIIIDPRAYRSPSPRPHRTRKPAARPTPRRTHDPHGVPPPDRFGRMDTHPPTPQPT